VQYLYCAVEIFIFVPLQHISNAILLESVPQQESVLFQTPLPQERQMSMQAKTRYM